MPAEEQRDPYAFGRLILDYLRVFIWPLVILVVIFIYQNDIRKILSEREVDIFGLRIGKQVADIEKRTLAEIDDIRILLEKQRAGESADVNDISKDIEAKLTSLENNLNREIGRIQQTQEQIEMATQKTASDEIGTRPTATRLERAAAAERQGFEHLLERDVDGAIGAFGRAYEIWPDYHNVQEILESLEKAKDRLRSRDNSSWNQLYRMILTKYSWGLPKDLRLQFREKTAAAY